MLVPLLSCDCSLLVSGGIPLAAGSIWLGTLAAPQDHVVKWFFVFLTQLSYQAWDHASSCANEVGWPV